MASVLSNTKKIYYNQKISQRFNMEFLKMFGNVFTLMGHKAAKLWRGLGFVHLRGGELDIRHTFIDFHKYIETRGW